MKIAGFDISINSPGKVIFDLNEEDFCIKSLKYYGFNTIKKRCLNQDNVNIVHVGSDYVKKNIFERQDTAYEILMRDMEEVKFVAMEGYSYSSGSSNSLFQIGEYSGGIKKLIYDAGKTIILYSPSTVKKFATGSGAAQKINMKQSMVSNYSQYYPICLETLPQYESPQADLIDAFFLAEVLRNHLLFEKNPNLLSPEILLALQSKSSKKTGSILETQSFKKKKI